MRIFEDLFTGDEIVSDGFKMVWKFSDTTAEIKGRMIVIGGDEEVDIGRGNAFGGKDEEDEEGGEAAGKQKAIDLVNKYSYCETSFNSKKDWQLHFKEYMGRVKEKIPENRQENFKKGATEFATWVSKNWKDITIWTPSDYQLENSLIYSYWQDEEKDEAPTFVYFLEGCRAVKC